MMVPLAVERVAWDLIVPYIARGDYAAARLTCRDLQLALDGNSSTAASEIRVANWSALHTPVTLQHNIEHLEAHVSSAQDWVALQQFLQHLPQLCSLSCLGRRTWPPQLSRQDSSSVVPHNHLRGVRFHGFLTSLVELSALAPQLDTLCCSTLVLQQPGVGCSSSRSTPGSLPFCLQLAAEAVNISADDEAAAGEAFAAALPRLQVLCHVPQFTWNIPKGFHTTRCVLPLQQALHCCSSLSAARAFGRSTVMGGLLPVQLQDLPQLQCLSVFGVGPAVELLGISRLTQLVALSLAYELPDKRANNKLLCQVGRLPRLKVLALPAKLLCSRCCADAQVHLQSLLLQRPGVRGSGVSASSNNHNSDGPFQQLQHVMFMCRPQERLYKCGDFCKHLSPAELQDLANQFAVAVQCAPAQHAAESTPGVGPALTAGSCEAPAVLGQLQGPSSQAPHTCPQLQAPLVLRTGVEGAKGLSVGFVQLGPKPAAHQPVPLSVSGGAGVWKAFGLADWFC